MIYLFVQILLIYNNKLFTHYKQYMFKIPNSKSRN